MNLQTMLRCFTLVVFSLLLCLESKAQTSDLGIPYTLQDKSLQKNIKFVAMEFVDGEKEILQAEQDVSVNREKLLFYGKPLPVNIDILSEATKTVLSSGDVVYQLGISCSKAVSINIIFDKFHLKSGSKVYVVGVNKQSYIGAYTSLNNSEASILGTELVNDSSIIVELIEPFENRGSSVLHIETVVHGYRSLEALVKRSLNGSGICNMDVNCPQGRGFERQRNSVAMIINSTGGFCTGTLMNTTAGPFKPYFLSAYHCGTTPGSWVFRFRWESPELNADCGTTKPSVDGPKDMSVNGATLVASYKTTDFILCELNATPSPLWNIVYAGWDKSGNIPQFGTGIHHPNADIKKISLDYDPLVAEAFNLGEPLNHWRTNWDQGVTESGSSGSPLFDHNHRVIGQLHGGDSDCISKYLTDYYAKLSESWNGGGTSDTRLKDWLDPVNADVDAIDGSPLVNNDPYIPFHASNLQGRICSDSIQPYVLLYNGGQDTLTSMKVNYSYDSEVTKQVSWKGKLGLYQHDTLFLPAQKFQKGNHLFTANLVLDSGFVDSELSNNIFTTDFTIYTGLKKYTLQLQLDTKGDETAWYLTDSTNKNVYQGGPYQRTVQQPPLIQEVFCLEPNCFTFTVYDNEGDGMYVNDSIKGSYALVDENKNAVVSLSTSQAKFGSNSAKNFCYTSSLELTIMDDLLKVFPNPTNLDEITITSSLSGIEKVKLLSITGQEIGIYSSSELQVKIPIAQVLPGMYYLNIQVAGKLVIKPFVRL
jgi:hypothetical protein